jgi:voltage-gated potassium channel
MPRARDRLGSGLRRLRVRQGRADQVERAFDIPLLIAALLVIPLLMIEESSTRGAFSALAATLNWALWLAFASELLVMLVISPRPLRWLGRNPLNVAIVVLTPPLLPAGLAALRLFRLLRLLRLALVVKQTRRLFSPDGVKVAALVAGAAAFAGAAIFADVEPRYSLWDGVWWAVATMATIGGGNVVPHTVTSRIVGIVLMPIGIGFFALLTGAIAHRFLEPRDERGLDGELRQELDRVHERLQRIEVALARLGAQPRTRVRASTRRSSR